MTGLSEPDANVEGVSGALHLLCILRGLLEPRRQLLHHRQLALLCKSFAAVLMRGLSHCRGRMLVCGVLLPLSSICCGCHLWMWLAAIQM